MRYKAEAGSSKPGFVRHGLMIQGKNSGFGRNGDGNGEEKEILFKRINTELFYPCKISQPSWPPTDLNDSDHR